MKSVGEYAKRYGYVRDMWGRIRFIPGIRSTNSWVRMEAERQAGNAPIQMGAQGVIKEAMGRLVPVYREINKETGYCQPLIQIHDDIVWEMEEWMVPIVQPRVKQVMEGVAPADFIIPLKVDTKVGGKWGSLEKWE
jgi:DNA polymerase-1